MVKSTYLWKMKLILGSILLVFTLFACQEDEVQATKKEGKNKSLVQYAQFFQLEKKENGFQLKIIDPKTKQEALTLHLFEQVEQTENKNSILTTTDQFAVLSQTVVGMFSEIGATSRISAISNSKYLYNKKLKGRIAQKTLFEIGELHNSSIEYILQTHSDVILFSGFGNSLPQQEKLQKLGIKSIPLYDWRETTPLGKAEWIKLIGALTGKFKEANQYFEKIKKEYNRLKTVAKSTSQKPSVLAGNKFGEIWYTPAGESFVAQFFADANLDYVYKNTEGTGSLEKSFEQIIAEAAQSSLWINCEVPSAKRLLENNPKLKFIDAFPENTYCYSHNMNHFWELSAIQPHFVLHDLISIAHPELISTDTMYFYKKIDF